MTPKTRINLSKLGFEGLEIDALDKLLDMLKELNKVSDVDDLSRLVNIYIREKYSLSQELAIIRQRDIKPEEFEAYSSYVEECKIKAKEQLK